MAFAFGAAREDYAQGRHPRVYCSAAQLVVMRRRSRRGPLAAVANALRQNLAAALANLPPPGAPLTLENTTAVRQQFFALALLATLDRNEAQLAQARRVLLALPTLLPAGQHLTTVAGLSFGHFSLAYDLLFPLLSAAESQAFAAWLLNGVIRPAIAAARPHFLLHSAGNMQFYAIVPTLLGLLAIQGDPGTDDTREDRRELLLFLRAAMATAIGPDGYPEEDMGYGTYEAGALAEIAEAARRAGIYDPYTDLPNYGRFGRAMLHFIQPWGDCLSMTGDHGDDFGARCVILARQAATLRAPELLWLLGALHYPSRISGPPSPVPSDVPADHGLRLPVSPFTLVLAPPMARARPPTLARVPTAYRERGRGLVSFRDSWDPEATFVLFDGSQRSPSGQGHAHASGGHFSISALGEYLAVDSGRYNMEQNCHNVVLINGQSGRTTDGQWTAMVHHGLLTGYQPGSFCDSAEVDSSHQHHCQWAWRTLGLVKGHGIPAYVWTVDNINAGNDWAQFDWQLHSSPENTIAIAGEQATITGWRHGHHLDVHLTLPAAADYPKPHRFLPWMQDLPQTSSWRCDFLKFPGNPPRLPLSYGQRPADQMHYSLFYRPRLLARFEGYNGRVLALMLPRHRGAPPAPVTRLATLPNALAVKVTFAAVEDTLIYAFEHQLLEAGDIQGRGQWCVVRRDRASGAVLAWEISQGTRLSVAGHALRVKQQKQQLQKQQRQQQQR